MLKYIFLGIIQGLTEFLPVSSSGHLVIAQYILGITSNQVTITVVLHLGTGLALLAFFLKDLLGLIRNFKLLIFLFITTIITVIIGLLGRDFFESLFSSPRAVAIGFIITGATLMLTKRFMSGKRDALGLKDAVILGLAQSIAIIPGISRSGATVSALLFRKIDRENSFRFSFLAAIPVIFGAAILEARKLDFAIKTEVINLLAGFVVSFLFGILSLNILKVVMHKAKLYYFGYYCILAAIITFLFK